MILSDEPRAWRGVKLRSGRVIDERGTLREDPRRLVGVIRRNDVVRAYNLRPQGREALDMPTSLRRIGAVEFLEVRLEVSAPCVGRSVAGMSRGRPADSLLVSIRRADGEVVFPHGDTRFESGDRVTVYARSEQADDVRRRLAG